MIIFTAIVVAFCFLLILSILFLLMLNPHTVGHTLFFGRWGFLLISKPRCLLSNTVHNPGALPTARIVLLFPVAGVGFLVVTKPG